MRGIRIGRLGGIRIAVDVSFLFIFGLVTAGLGAAVFPAWHPDWSPLLTWSIAGSAAILFFASVLAHEMAHSLVARHYGIPVRSITLFLLGGVSDIEEEPSSAGVEALMAAVGPLTSIVLGVGFTAAARAITPPAPPGASAMQVLAGMGPLATLLGWLGPINIIVGAFNLVPGFPLDGGRILRATLWGITGNALEATRWAATIGRGFGWLLILAGVAMLFGVAVPFFGAGIEGIWIALIGWFLVAAAGSSYRQMVARELLRGVQVRDLMRRALPPVVDGSTSVRAFVDRYIVPGGDTLFPVAEDGRVEQAVEVRAVRKVPRGRWDETPVRSIATQISSMPVVRPEENAYSALKKLADLRGDELLVLEDGEPGGVLRRRDIARWMETHAPSGRAGPRRRGW